MASNKKFKYPLVVVTWEDAHSESTWMNTEDFKVETTLVTSAGFLFKQDESHLVLTLGYADDDILDRLRIPIGMVRSVTVIRKAE